MIDFLNNQKNIIADSVRQFVETHEKSRWSNLYRNSIKSSETYIVLKPCEFYVGDSQTMVAEVAL